MTSLNSNSRFEWNHSMLLRVASHVILWSLLCSLLLYKWLPSKVTLLSLVLIVYFIRLQLFSEVKLYLSTSLISNTALHIEIISLVDRTYELIQEPDEDTSEVQVNISEDNEDLNVNSKFDSKLNYMKSNQHRGINCSPEPRFGRANAYRLYKPF